jgi:hypothetical protein
MKIMTEQFIRSLAILALLSTTGIALVHAVAVQAAVPPSAGTHLLGVTPSAAAHLVAPYKPPITVPTPLPVLPSGPVTAPGLSPLQATASSVTVSWSDRSTNELGFKVFRRDLSGNWHLVDQVASRDVRGSGSTYSWVDTSTDLSGQCYMIAAYNANAGGSTAEECTVRPDPRRFPLLVPYAQEWSGLSDTNDGTGELLNIDNNQQLRYADGTFWHGVNLAWGNSSLWRIEAQGGPHLMKGQAVALKVWGGGWLAYGNQTWGVDLQLSSTPVYEWYAIGRRNDPSDSSWAGSDLEDGGGFALWNSSAHAYLLASYQTWGVSLNWSNLVGNPAPPPPPSPTQQGVKTEQVFNCATDQSQNPQPVEVWIADQTDGGSFLDEGTLDAQYDPDGVACPAFGSVPYTFSPQSGHQYRLVATDSALPGCESDDPQDGFCQKMDVQFVGDANGCTETDIIDGPTQINCAAGLGGAAHRVKLRGRLP